MRRSGRSWSAPRTRSPRHGCGASGSAAGCGKVGILAAAGLWALDHHIERLADDHDQARRAAQACAESAPGCVDPPRSRREYRRRRRRGRVGRRPFVAALAEAGDARVCRQPTAVRLVWHLDVDEAATSYAVDVLTATLAAGTRRR